MRKALFTIGFSLLSLSTAFAQSLTVTETSPCNVSGSVVSTIEKDFIKVATENNGGLFTPARQWGAIVDRQGNICTVFNTSLDPWPGSRDIAIAKAETANDFSNVALALSTANLYGPTQPGGSLYGLNNSNPFNPAYDAQGSLNGGSEVAFNGTFSGVSVKVPGGIITFGGGVALYQDGAVIGGFGTSGDTSCADHAIAYRTRQLAGYVPPPGLGPNSGTDNIVYYPPGEVNNSEQNTNQFAQPHCLSTDITP